MAHSSRLVLAALLLLPGVLAAQESMDSMRAAATRDAERYVSCFMSRAMDCPRELSYSEAYLESGSASRDMTALRGALVVANDRALGGLGIPDSGIAEPGFVVPGLADYFWIEVAEAWPPFAVSAARFVYVPYFASFEDPASGRRVDRMSYFIGQSANDGESWRFFAVRHDLKAREIEGVIPGQGDVPRPEFRDVIIKEGRPEQSRWLATTVRRIVTADELHYYVLAFAIREEFTAPIDITVRYDNPANPVAPSSACGSLEPGQAELRWQSPPMAGFEADRTYEVVIEGSDPGTGELLFEHREELLFPPTRELWLQTLSQPPAANPDEAPGP